MSLRNDGEWKELVERLLGAEPSIARDAFREQLEPGDWAALFERLRSDERATRDRALGELAQALHWKKLFERLQSKDRSTAHAAYTELVEARYALEFGWLIRTRRSVAEAEEGLQHGFLNVWRFRSSFRPRRKPLAYVHRIVLNAANREWRAQQRFGDQRAVEDGGPSARTRVELQEAIECCLRALGELSSDDQLVLAGKFFQEITSAELAELFGVSRNALDVRLHRARKRLFAQLRKKPCGLELLARYRPSELPQSSRKDDPAEAMACMGLRRGSLS